jgi:hypothetical protein
MASMSNRPAGLRSSSWPPVLFLALVLYPAVNVHPYHPGQTGTFARQPAPTQDTLARGICNSSTSSASRLLTVWRR